MAMIILVAAVNIVVLSLKKASLPVIRLALRPLTGGVFTPIPSIIRACFHSLPVTAMSGRTPTNVGLALNVLTSGRKLIICLKLPGIVLVKCGLPSFY